MSNSTKRCTKCGKEKSITAFHRGKHWCKDCVNEYNRQWYAEHSEEAKARSRQYQRNHKKQRKIYRAKYYEKNKAAIRIKTKEWYLKNKNTDKFKEYQRAKAKEWREKNPEKAREVYRRYNRKVRLQALQMISGFEIPECNVCGCKDLRVLEVNHKNGGGAQEYRSIRKKGGSIYKIIVKGYRKVDDLEVLCKVCNAKHYVEEKFDLKYQVEFLGGAG